MGSIKSPIFFAGFVCFYGFFYFDSRAWLVGLVLFFLISFCCSVVGSKVMFKELDFRQCFGLILKSTVLSFSSSFSIAFGFFFNWCLPMDYP